MPTQRLDKTIASQGAYSRSDVRKLVRSGFVTVNGSVATDSGMSVDPDSDKITVCGRDLGYSKYVYIMLNKPQGVVSASRSPGEKTVVDLVPPEYKRNGLFPAGRLDKDTTGFVLITDDGDFAHRILSPASHVQKTYIATLDSPLEQGSADSFRKGVVLADGYECMPAEIRELSDDGTVVEIKLREGKYHQIKRMAAACGSHVTALCRTDIGGVALDGRLGLGECRLLTAGELDLLQNGY